MLLERLCNATGPSGYEGEIRNIIKEEIADYVDEIKVDVMGNIIVHKKGTGPKVLLDAHMDEVGFIITGFNKDGTLRFSAIGSSIHPKVIPCKVLQIGENKISGVIGLKPIHLQSKEESEKNISYSNCCIDIGAFPEEESRKKIKLGDFAVFSTTFSEFGEGLLKGKAFDDRMGCAVLIEILKEEYSCDLYASFSVQEEVGIRGAYVSAYNIQPDIGIAVEGTICADFPSVPPHLMATEIGKGPALSIMDHATLYNQDLLKDLTTLANKNKIPYQFRRSTAGGNDAAAIQQSGKGAKVAALSVPCRYIHSSVSVASKSDYENTIALLRAYLKTL